MYTSVIFKEIKAITVDFHLQLAGSAEETAGVKLMQVTLSQGDILPLYVRYSPSAVQHLTGRVYVKVVGDSTRKYSVSEMLFILFDPKTARKMEHLVISAAASLSVHLAGQSKIKKPL